MMGDSEAEPEPASVSAIVVQRSTHPWSKSSMPTDSDSNSAPATPESTHSSDFATTESYRWAGMKTLEWTNGTRDLVLEDLIVDGAFECVLLSVTNAIYLITFDSPEPTGLPTGGSFYDVKPEQPLGQPPSQLQPPPLPTQSAQPRISNPSKQNCSESVPL